jgi:anti-anti-sigma factor
MTNTGQQRRIPDPEPAGAAGSPERVVVADLAGGMSDPLLKVEVGTSVAGDVVVMLEGEFDLSTEAVFRSVLEGVMEHSPWSLIIDFDGVRFMDSTGLHALIRIHQAAADAGCRLLLTQLRPSVRRTLDIAGLTPLFEISNDEVRAESCDGSSPIEGIGA